MRHHNTKRKFGRETNQRRALMKSLAVNLIKNDKIKTTEAKAKELRPFIEKLVTKAKAGDLAKRKLVMVSGGFDPVHIGHVRMFKEAKKLGTELVVVLNNDNWLKFKKGVAFMPEADRKEIIEAFKPVDRVIVTAHKKNTKDITVCRELELIRPDVFANGGDRQENVPVPEYETCERLGIKMVFNVGHGGKVRSSSKLLQKYSNKNLSKVHLAKKK